MLLEEEEADPTVRMVSGAKMRAMMQLLVAEAGFLVDDEVKTALESLPPEESDLAQAESMLRALGVENEQDVKALLEYFFPKPQEGDDDVMDAVTKWVAAALRAFYGVVESA